MIRKHWLGYLNEPFHCQHLVDSRFKIQIHLFIKITWFQHGLIHWHWLLIIVEFYPCLLLITVDMEILMNTLRPRQNGRRFAYDTFQRIFLNENVRISIEISLKFVPKGPINNNPALVQIMARRRSGDKPLSEPMLVRLPTHICVARPQWVKAWSRCHKDHHKCIGKCAMIKFFQRCIDASRWWANTGLDVGWGIVA